MDGSGRNVLFRMKATKLFVAFLFSASVITPVVLITLNTPRKAYLGTRNVHATMNLQLPLLIRKHAGKAFPCFISALHLVVEDLHQAELSLAGHYSCHRHSRYESSARVSVNHIENERNGLECI